MMKNLWTLIVGVLLGSTLLLGCQFEPTYPTAPETNVVSPPRVALEPGDVVEIKFYYTPQLNVTQTVRPDGKIMLLLVGEIEVQGKTPAELRSELVKRCTPLLEKDPEVAVIVRSFFNRCVFVGGQVMTPGVVEMPGKIHVLKAIMQAGGFDMREAEVRNVVVIRHRDGQRYGYSVNLKPALEGGETHPFFLEPQDIVYVPRTKIAKVGQWVDQHINKIIPKTGFIFTRTSGRTRIGVGSYY
jgi:protein involved in polysaccharide export with SLBB domain